jgi:agarase
VAATGTVHPAGAGPTSPVASPKATATPVATGPTFKATGYFRTQDRDGRWYLVTPDGHPFYSTGVDHVTASPDVDQTTGQCPYCEAVAAQYPSTAAWATATVAQLRSWGFNSLGAFTDDATFATQMPYSVQLSMASGDDWFAKSFVSHAKAVAAAQVAPLADDPNLIGYYTDSELHWGPDGSDTAPVLDNYLALPVGSPGRTVAEKYAHDPNGFVSALATRYFSVTTAAVHKYDPHHLILGVKAEAQEIQPQLLEAASPYVDVFSIDEYQLEPGLAQLIDELFPQYLPVKPKLGNFEHYVHKPLMIGEYSFIASGPATPDTVPGLYAVYPTQQARAQAYTDFIAPLYEQATWVVGDEWFEYVDEPQGGRFDGENNNFGLVDVTNQPYPELVAQMEVMHSVAPDRIGQTGPTCDSWTTATGTLTCDATLPAASYPLSIFTDSLAAGTVGAPTSDQVVAGGGTPAYTYSLAAPGSLPPGLSLDPRKGTISGTPTAAGTFPFTVEVSDSTSPTPQTASQSLSITVAAS